MSIETHPVIENNEWRWVFVASTLLMVAISLPLIVAYAGVPSDQQFLGIINNPIDGASYLAKMEQGYSGEWLLHDPYTPEPHRGVFLYTYYLALGHLARLLGLSLILVFHAARLIGSLFMFVMVYVFVADWTADVGQRRIAWGLGIVGSGLWWLLLVLGRVNPTPDLLILPEAFPLQAAYTSAHFPLAIAIALWIGHTLLSVALIETNRWPRLDGTTIGLALSALTLVSVSPFTLVPILTSYGTMLAVMWWRRKRLPRREIAWLNLILIFAIPLAAYSGWAVSSANPVFSSWMRQNVTPSPPVWEYLIAFGPLLTLAVIGIWRSSRMLEIRDIYLIGIIVAIFVMAYAPLGLQRRFLIGVNVYLGVYASVGLWRVIVPPLSPFVRLLVVGIVLMVATLTSILALAISLTFVRIPELGRLHFINASEVEAMDWLAEKAPKPLVLASPDLGLFLPTRGLHVVFGHEFETVNAAERKQAVLDYFTGVDCSVAQREGVDYIIVGPREKQVEGFSTTCIPRTDPVFVSTDSKLSVFATANP